MTKNARKTYHHGDLEAALVAATEEIIRTEGAEGFSLRKAARRAGASSRTPEIYSVAYRKMESLSMATSSTAR